MDVSGYKSFAERIISNCGKVIVGKDEVITQVVIGLLCSGHVLLEDVPGTGKTMLFKAFAKSIGGEFKRIQFTPDLLPSDLTGISVYNQKVSEFRFRKGPVFTNMLLADEINRATPRTQSALLEAMEEHQVSVDGSTYRLKEPFMVMATQNPIESYGTFPLPEAQMDRFFMKLGMGYMLRSQELSVIARPSTAAIVDELEAVTDSDEIMNLRRTLPDIRVNADVAEYIMNIVQKTRENNRIAAGVSTRGAIALYKASQAAAAISGREFVIPEDVKREAVCVLPHRLLGLPGRNDDMNDAIVQILEAVPVPLENE